MRLLLIVTTAICCFGQAFLDPAKLLQAPTDSWPTYNGDYSGRRFSPLKKINQSNVDALTLAWVRRTVVAGRQAGGGNNAAVIKGTPIVINGVMYYTIPDHAWAIDARTGRRSGITNGRRRADGISGIVGRPRGGTRCISRPPIATWLLSIWATARSAGTPPYATWSSSIMRPSRRSSYGSMSLRA